MSTDSGSGSAVNNSGSNSQSVPGSASHSAAAGASSVNKTGRKGDPRMHKAVSARLADPELSLFEALKIGGFDYEVDDDSRAVDAGGVTLGQRKNQLSRRIRFARKHGQVAQYTNSTKRNSASSGRQSDKAGVAQSYQPQASAVAHNNHYQDGATMMNMNVPGGQPMASDNNMFAAATGDVMGRGHKRLASSLEDVGDNDRLGGGSQEGIKSARASASAATASGPGAEAVDRSIHIKAKNHPDFQPILVAPSGSFGNSILQRAQGNFHANLLHGGNFSSATAAAPSSPIGPPLANPTGTEDPNFRLPTAAGAAAQGTQQQMYAIQQVPPLPYTAIMAQQAAVAAASANAPNVHPPPPPSTMAASQGMFPLTRSAPSGVAVNSLTMTARSIGMTLEQMALALSQCRNLAEVLSSDPVTTALVGNIGDGQKKQEENEREEGTNSSQRAKSAGADAMISGFLDTSPPVPSSHKEDMALNLYQNENHSLYTRSMLLAGFPAEHASPGKREYVNFTIKAWQLEGRRLRDLYDAINNPTKDKNIQQDSGSDGRKEDAEGRDSNGGIMSPPGGDGHPAPFSNDDNDGEDRPMPRIDGELHDDLGRVEGGCSGGYGHQNEECADSTARETENGREEAAAAPAAAAERCDEGSIASEQLLPNLGAPQQADVDEAAAAAAASASACDVHGGRHVHRLEGCGHRAIVHQPQDGAVHIDFVVGDKIECYQGVSPVAGSENSTSVSVWPSQYRCEDLCCTKDSCPSEMANLPHSDEECRALSVPKLLDLGDVDFKGREWGSNLSNGQIDETLLGLFKLSSDKSEV